MRQDDTEVKIINGKISEPGAIGTFGRIGSIKLLSVYRTNKKNGLLISPPDRLLKLLNLNIDNDKAIIDYMESYKVYPTGDFSNDIKQGILQAFREEYKIITEIARRALKNKTTQEDINLLNEKIKNIKKSLRKLDEKEALTINENINSLGKREGVFNKYPDKPSIISYSTYDNSFSVIYDDLYYLCLRKSGLRTCKYCGAFFSPARIDQVYCDPTHKEASREIRRKSTRKK